MTGPSEDKESETRRSLIKGVEHVAIATKDPQRLARWYLEHLNFAPLLDTGTTVYIKAPNSVILEFVAAESTCPSPGIRDSGIRHIAFSVDDLEAAQAQLKSTGIEFEPQPIVLPGMRLHFFRDLDGNYLHLVCREKPLL
jgi:glyoxylase I family protein